MSLVYMFCADGFEEVEGLTQVDLLRRAGADIKMVSITGSRMVNGAHGIRVEADILYEEIDQKADMLLLPGGMPGTIHLKEHEGLAAMLQEQNSENGFIAAICAAPSVLGELGLLQNRRATSYPGAMDSSLCKEYVEEPVVRDGNIITSRGVGTAIPFGLCLIEALLDSESADAIAESIVYR